jgi:hypothetical protein
VHNKLWKNINTIQEALCIGDADFSKLIDIKKGYTKKKTSELDLPAKSFFLLSEIFGLSFELLMSDGEIDFDNLAKNYNNPHFFMREKYKSDALAMTSSLLAILDMAKSKQMYDYVVRELQISKIHLYREDSVCLSLVNDAFVAMEGFLSIDEIKTIGENNFNRFKQTIDEDYFKRLSSSRKLYENFVHYLTLIQDIFTFEIEHLDEKEIIFSSRPTPILINSLGNNYDNEYTIIMRMFFASCANKLNGNNYARGKVVSSTLQGDPYTKFAFQFSC